MTGAPKLGAGVDGAGAPNDAGVIPPKLGVDGAGVPLATPANFS
jgi:hypothetical protein